MTDYSIDSMHGIRTFLWAELLNAKIFDAEDYYSDNFGGFLIPIFPVQQVPEMTQFLNGKKHIVYDKTGTKYDDNWLVCNEMVSLDIFADDVNDINAIRNLIIDAFRRMDESARDVNLQLPYNTPFIYHTIYVTDMSITAPSEDIKGFMSANVMLEIKYSRKVDSSGRYL